MKGETDEAVKRLVCAMVVNRKSIKPIHGRDGYFRVTPGVDEENERFVRFVRNYFGKK